MKCFAWCTEQYGKFLVSINVMFYMMYRTTRFLVSVNMFYMMYRTTRFLVSVNMFYVMHRAHLTQCPKRTETITDNLHQNTFIVGSTSCEIYTTHFALSHFQGFSLCWKPRHQTDASQKYSHFHNQLCTKLENFKSRGNRRVPAE